MEAEPKGTRAAAAVRWALIALVAVAALLSVGSWAGIFHRAPATSTRTATELYHCPMHPAVTSDRPGECPICGMTLVKASSVLTEGTSAIPGLARVELPDDRVQRMGVRTMTARTVPFTEPVKTVAIIAADESRLARVQTRFSGWIESLPVSETGRKVAKGEVLATIFSKELLTAQQEFLDARGWQGDLAAQARQRLELMGVAGEEIDAIAKAGKPIAALPIRAPISGYVTFKGAVAGLYVDPGTELFEIADLARVWAWADVYERDLARVRVGQPATITIPSLGRSFEGKVGFLQPAIDPASRTLKARIELANADLALKPGMFGDAVLHTAPHDGLMIDREALIDTGERQYVFVRVASGTFEPRPVTTGRRTDDAVEILSGLSDGDEVVTSGNFLLDSESRLRASVSSAASKAATSRTDVPIDRGKFPEKYDQWLQCEQTHRGMGSMEEDCKSSIPKPWR